MPLPALVEWDTTRTALHQAAMVLPPFRKATDDPLPNHLHLALTPQLNGAGTGPLSIGGSLEVDFITQSVDWEKDGDTVFTVPIAGETQQSLFEKVKAKFAEHGHDLDPPVNEPWTTDALAPDVTQAHNYALVFWRMWTVLAQTHARFVGPVTPVVLWPHGFDLSTIWFAGGGFSEEEDPHMNFGFSPGTPDVGEPYFYSYAWPAIEGFEATLPDVVEWHTEWGSPGALLRYSKFAAADDPEAIARETLLAIYRAGAARM